MVQWEGLELVESTWITEGDLLNLDLVNWKQFEDSNLQEFHSFQLEDNDATIFEGCKKMNDEDIYGVINFDSVIYLGSNLTGSCILKCSL